jgi:hypothetical protein
MSGAARGNAVENTFIDWQTWTGGNSLPLVSFFDTIEFQILSATGGPWTPARASDGATWDFCVVYDQLGNPYQSITTSHVGKMFSADGRAGFKLIPSNQSDVISGNIRAS